MSEYVILGTPAAFDFQAFSQSTEKAFALLVPLIQLQPSKPGITHDVVVQAAEFMKAVSLGVGAAQSGYTAATDILGLTEFMDSTSPADRAEYLQGTLRLSRKAHQDAQQAHKTLRDIRTKIMQIMSESDTPQGLPDITSPPFKEFFEGAEILEKFGSEASALAQWWEWIKIETDVARTDKSNMAFDDSSLRLDHVIERWKLLRAQFADYSSMVSKLQDAYPDWQSQPTLFDNHNDGQQTEVASMTRFRRIIKSALSRFSYKEARATTASQTQTPTESKARRVKDTANEQRFQALSPSHRDFIQPHDPLSAEEQFPQPPALVGSDIPQTNLGPDAKNCDSQKPGYRDDVKAVSVPEQKAANTVLPADNAPLNKNSSKLWEKIFGTVTRKIPIRKSSKLEHVTADPGSSFSSRIMDPEIVSSHGTETAQSRVVNQDGSQDANKKTASTKLDRKATSPGDKSPIVHTATNPVSEESEPSKPHNALGIDGEKHGELKTGSKKGIDQTLKHAEDSTPRPITEGPALATKSESLEPVSNPTGKAKKSKWHRIFGDRADSKSTIVKKT